MPPQITLETARTVTTSAATMRSLVTPTTSPAMDVAVWHTELPAGVAGPEHTIDRDQLVVVLSGTVAVDLDGSAHEIPAGEAFLLPGGRPRVIRAADDAPATTVTVGYPRALATVGDGAPVEVPWTA